MGKEQKPAEWNQGKRTQPGLEGKLHLCSKANFADLSWA